MRTIITLFVVFFLSSCTVYTITNTSDRDFQVKKSGGSHFTLKALECIELREYFLGLGGEFPFFVIEGSEEYSANNYEIKLQKNTTSTHSAKRVIVGKYIVVNSVRNKRCESTLTVKKDIQVKSEDSPVCTNSTDNVLCTQGTAKCVYNAANTHKVAVCVNNQNKSLQNIVPSCKGSTVQPRCVFTTVATVSTTKQALCLTGDVQCSIGVAKCVYNGKQSKDAAACVDTNNKKLHNVIISCSDDTLPICLETVKKITKADIIPKCAGNKTTVCLGGGDPICGFHSGDSSVKPYCVNKNSILWISDVRCSGDDLAAPTCNPDSSNPNPTPII